MDRDPLSRKELLQAAEEERASGNTGLASLLAEEAEYAPNSPEDNARVMRAYGREV
ncbi:hypothetical protein SLNWT_3625 [Streptomyces albus]|uniref:Uncharacterized protein n=1 Tax=Streptomyces albus (strain ATCC 21838 / DSM 41398 / FERM P-419 / JCM 4703 / NBRC 107858) TaxID=1081613 RepID=A0A0B5EZG1_STRA4|nr:hypothetical protein SLNWT_3625 [Streptomyces albus]AOU78305.1 hypothetical protein SLNHY_3614 [Streptomyces albus]AYN34056.1 hypothetical protein DUI70_3555 [Streptomyces albus]